MKIELVSVVDMWEELKNSDKNNVWNDDNVFESVSMDEFVDDVNEMYVEREGKGGWFLSDFENINEIDGEYLERE
jgi:hypothetical protein